MLPHCEFLEIASLLGHNPDRLPAGEEQISFLLLSGIEDVRRVFSRAGSGQRRERGRTFFDEIRGRSRLGQGMHDRCEAYVFADGEVNSADVAGLNHHLPAHVKAVSILEKTVKSGQVWDVSTRASDWGLAEDVELYCIVNLGTLILEPGASLVVRGNVFSLVCQQVEIRGESEFDIGIRPTPFPQGRRPGLSNGQPGRAGVDGTAGVSGQAPVLASSVLGPVLLASAGNPTGGPGAHGGNGAPGEHGRNGGASKIAEITLRGIRSSGRPVTVFAQAGPGGDGGDGGKGGDGGNGGDGTDGCRTVTGLVWGGVAGAGGDGGDGGRGGAGGHGGIGSNIYVCVPVELAGRVNLVALAAQPGRPGRGGKPGLGGVGGRPGTTPGGASKEPPASAGNPGHSGMDGAAGRSRRAPAIFLNERWERGTDSTQAQATGDSTPYA